MSIAANPEPAFVYLADLLRIIDGDTLRCRIDLGFGISNILDVRLSGVDTPEVRGVEAPAGKWVTKQVAHWLNERTELVLQSKVFKLGKYGRCLAEVWCQNESLNAWLWDSGYAWRTDDKGAIIGSRSVEMLDVPDEIKREVQRRAVA